jgi:hypothetical protein
MDDIVENEEYDIEFVDGVFDMDVDCLCGYMYRFRIIEHDDRLSVKLIVLGIGGEN